MTDSIITFNSEYAAYGLLIWLAVLVGSIFIFYVIGWMLEYIFHSKGLKYD